jgi:ABC-type branched-subunit amino acid transport system substrate-binding protein
VRGSRPAPPNESSNLVYAGFLAAYKAEYGEDARPYSFVAHSYDAAWLTAFASVWALARQGGINGTNLARGLRRMSQGTEIEIRQTSWNLAVQQLSSGASIDVEGASGALDYGPDEEISADIEFWTIEHGSIIGVGTWSGK